MLALAQLVLGTPSSCGVWGDLSWQWHLGQSLSPLSVFSTAVASNTTIKGLVCVQESFRLARDNEDTGINPTLRLSTHQVLGQSRGPVQLGSPSTQGCPSTGSEVASGRAGGADAEVHTPTRMWMSVRGHETASAGQWEVSLDRHRWGNMLTNAGFFHPPVHPHVPRPPGAAGLLPQVGLNLICARPM